MSEFCSKEYIVLAQTKFSQPEVESNELRDMFWFGLIRWGDKTWERTHIMYLYHVVYLISYTFIFDVIIIFSDEAGSGSIGDSLGPIDAGKNQVLFNFYFRFKNWVKNYIFCLF